MGALHFSHVFVSPYVKFQCCFTRGLFVAERFRILELYIGLICACFLAFPAFIDRFGPRFMSRLKSYPHLWRSPAGTSVARSNEGGRSSRDSRTLNSNSDEYVKLAGGKSATEMRDIAASSGTTGRNHPKSEKADNPDQDEVFPSSSLQAVPSAHIV